MARLAPEVRDALLARARAKGGSLSDVVAELLIDAESKPYDGDGARYRALAVDILLALAVTHAPALAALDVDVSLVSDALRLRPESAWRSHLVPRRRSEAIRLATLDTVAAAVAGGRRGRGESREMEVVVALAHARGGALYEEENP